MKRHHAVAVPLAALVAGLLVVDTVVLAVTGERTVVTDDAKGTRAESIAMGVLLGATLLGCIAVVVRERARFAAAPRVARLARVPLLVGLCLLALGTTVLHPVEVALGLDDGPFAVVSGLLALASLLLVFVPLLVLGLATLRSNPFGIGARVLAAIGPVIVLTVLLAFVAPGVASPVLVTGLALVGTALLGVRAPQPVGTDPERPVRGPVLST
ncbi:MAG: hypothetical protein HY830_25815 [Actinobacteria bacterium]|nr:hypothetical protein [Actinomycetota bacterium]